MHREINDIFNQHTPERVAGFLKTRGMATRTVTIAGTEEALSKQMQELEKQGLPAQRMRSMIHPGYALLYDLTEEDGVGVIILESLEADKTALPLDELTIDTITKKLSNQELSLLSTAFIDYLQKNATINTKEL